MPKVTLLLQSQLEKVIYGELFDFFKEQEHERCHEYAAKLSLQFAESIAKKAAELCGETNE